MSDSKKYLNLALIIFMALTCIAKCAFTIWGKNYLYADGASYCYEALRNAGMSLGIEGRNGSIVLMQLPMYIGFKLGITNINILCALFGFGAAVWYPLFTLLAIILACRKGKTEFAAGLAVLYVLIDVYSGFFTQIESITGVGVFVFLLMYYLAAEKNDWVYRVIASLLLFIMPNANEYFVGYGVVLLAVLVTRLIRERKNVYIIESVIHIAVVVWTIYSSYLAATQGAPTASLRMSVENLPYKKYYWIMLALVFASALLFLLAGIFSNVLFRILAALFAWGAVLWLGITVKDYTTLIATRSFSMRIMNLVLPCLCGGVI